MLSCLCFVCGRYLGSEERLEQHLRCKITDPAYACVDPTPETPANVASTSFRAPRKPLCEISSKTAHAANTFLLNDGPQSRSQEQSQQQNGNDGLSIPDSHGQSLRSDEQLWQYHWGDSTRASTIDPSQAQADYMSSLNKGALADRARPDLVRGTRWRLEQDNATIVDLGDELLNLTGDQPSISFRSESETIASYSWTKDDSPTVYIPGAAPVYTDKGKLPFTVNRKALPFVDPLGRLFPYEAILKAVEVMNPNFKFDKIGVITSPNCLFQLFKFCWDRPHIQKHSFRLILLTVQDTLVAHEYPDAADGSLCYGGLPQQIVQAVTVLPEDLTGSRSHFQVVRYNLGELEVVVPAYVHLCMEDSNMESPPTIGETNATTENGEGPQMTKVVDQTAAVNVKVNAETSPSLLNILHRGRGTLQKNTGQIRVVQTTTDILSFDERMWFARIPWLVKAKLTKGTITETIPIDVSSHLEKWQAEQRNQDALQKLAVLLSHLRDAVKCSTEQSCVVVYPGHGSALYISQTTPTAGVPLLPKALREKFWTRQR